MNAYDLTARGSALAGWTQDVIGSWYGDRAWWLWFPPQAGVAEQVAAGKTVDGGCRFGVARDRTGTRRARLLTWQAKENKQPFNGFILFNFRDQEHLKTTTFQELFCNVLGCHPFFFKTTVSCTPEYLSSLTFFALVFVKMKRKFSSEKIKMCLGTKCIFQCRIC